jgi:hypothetical protein
MGSPLNQSMPTRFNIASTMMRGIASDTQSPVAGRRVGAPCGKTGEIMMNRSNNFSSGRAITRRTKPPPEEKPMSVKLALG